VSRAAGRRPKSRKTKKDKELFDNILCCLSTLHNITQARSHARRDGSKHSSKSLQILMRSSTSCIIRSIIRRDQRPSEVKSRLFIVKSNTLMAILTVSQSQRHMQHTKKKRNHQPCTARSADRQIAFVARPNEQLLMTTKFLNPSTLENATSNICTPRPTTMMTNATLFLHSRSIHYGKGNLIYAIADAFPTCV